MEAPRILFLDDDHVLRIFRLVLSNREDDPWIGSWFAPEQVDLAPLVQAAHGLRPSEGAVVGLLPDHSAPVEDADIIVFRRGEITARTLDEYPSLQLVQRLGERTEGIDLAALHRRGVQLSCLPRRTLRFTAEHALLLMLARAKKLLPADAAVRRGMDAGASAVAAPDGVAYNWAGIAGATGLHGSTLGIVGLGEVGSLVARLATAFGMTVLYFKPRRADAQREMALGVSYATLDELLARSDYVSLHAPNVPENKGLAGRDFFGKMKRGACFINTSRGQLVDEDALYNALASGIIAGAGLDVHAIEPRPAGDRFVALPNVVLTPHLAGGARSGVIEEFKVMAENFRAAKRGQDVAYRVIGTGPTLRENCQRT